MGERKEVFIRVGIFIVSGTILLAWEYLIIIFLLVNFVHTLITGKRLKEIAELSEVWNTQYYIFQRYVLFLTNKRPFPFGRLEKNISKFEGKNREQYIK